MPPANGVVSRAIVAVAVAIAPAACGDTAPVDRGFSTRDSAGIVIAENRGAPPALIRVDAPPLLEVGVAQGAPELEFSDVVGAVITPAGTLVVADGMTRELRFFDAGGVHLRSFGRQGGGPGEFEALNSIALRGDSILAHDMRGWRFTLVGQSGDLLGTTPAGNAAFIGLLGDGALVSYDVLTREMPPPGSIGRTRAALLLHPPDGTGGAPIVEFEPNEYYVHTEIPGFSERIFRRSAAVVIGRDRILIADNGSYEIRELGPDGAVRRLIRRTGAPRPVTDADLRRFIDMTLEGYGRRRDLLGPTLTDQPPPDEMPAFGRSGVFDSRLPTVLEGPGGHVWVLQYMAFPDESPVWDVFDGSGRLLAAVELPVGFELTFVGERRLVGVYRDDLDVEKVRILAFDGI